MSEPTEVIDGLTGELERFREMHAETLLAHVDMCNRLAGRIQTLRAVLQRVDTALDQTSQILWKSLKAEIKLVLANAPPPTLPYSGSVTDSIDVAESFTEGK